MPADAGMFDADFTVIIAGGNLGRRETFQQRFEQGSADATAGAGYDDYVGLLGQWLELFFGYLLYTSLRSLWISWSSELSEWHTDPVGLAFMLNRSLIGIRTADESG